MSERLLLGLQGNPWKSSRKSAKMNPDQNKRGWSSVFFRVRTSFGWGHLNKGIHRFTRLERRQINGFFSRTPFKWSISKRPCVWIDWSASVEIDQLVTKVSSGNPPFPSSAPSKVGHKYLNPHRNIYVALDGDLTYDNKSWLDNCADKINSDTRSHLIVLSLSWVIRKSRNDPYFRVMVEFTPIFHLWTSFDRLEDKSMTDHQKRMKTDFVSTVEYIRSQLPPQLQRPRVGIVCGSGLSGLAGIIQNIHKIPYANIPGFGTSTGMGACIYTNHRHC